MTVWQPTQFLRFDDSLDTSTGTARIMTDAGRAHIKPLGRRGPHPLACEWVGTQLAKWFGLATLEFALMTIDAKVDEIWFKDGSKAESGTAFVTKSASGDEWGGDAETLDDLVNPNAVAKLVVFDTWTRNCDRYPPDLTQRKPNYANVFLENVTDSPSGTLRLLAIDHTECFTCGGDLNSKVSNIDRVKDDRLYGLFPGFTAKISVPAVDNAIETLQNVNKDSVSGFMATIPDDWQVAEAARNALVELICQRAVYVAETIKSKIASQCWPDRLFGPNH